MIGAGLRGRHTYGAWARSHPERLRVVAVAEPDETRRRAIAQEHGLAREAAFADWKDLLDRPRLAPVAIIATADDLHVAPALAALGRGYHLLLEKPIAPDPVGCVRVVEAAERAGRLLQMGWGASGGRALAAMEGFGEAQRERARRLGPPSAALRGHLGDLAKAAVALDLVRASESLSAARHDLSEMRRLWRPDETNPPVPASGDATAAPPDSARAGAATQASPPADAGRD